MERIISCPLFDGPGGVNSIGRVEVGERRPGHLDLLKEQGGEIKGEEVGEIGRFGIVAEAWDSKDGRGIRWPKR